MFKKLEHTAFLNGDGWLDALTDHFVEHGLDVRVDAAAGSDRPNLVVTAAGKRYKLATELVVKATPASVAALARTSMGRRVLLVTEHLNAATIAACRRLGVACADLDGNMYLRLASVHADIEGRPRTLSKDLGTARRASSALTTSSGAQVLFVLLADPAAVGLPMRDLAHASGTALGSVSSVVRDLADQNYLSIRDDGRRQLHRTAQLFDRWVESHRQRLHPKLVVGRYQTDTAKWWTSADSALRRAGAQWGGETAAWHIDHHLVPAQGVVYVSEMPTQLLTHYRMRKASDPTANVAIRHRFWNVPEWNKSITVPTPLIYADLVASDDPRQVEAAVRLREADELLRRLD